MLSYVIGKIVSINKKTITVESNWKGYIIWVTNPEAFEVNKVKKIYIHLHTALANKNSIQNEYYGFVNYDQKELFLKLISLNGIGPKTAMQILKNDTALIKNMIFNKDLKGLSSLTSINEKLAKLMIENIAVNIGKNVNASSKIAQLVNALKTLGYDKKDIELVVNNQEIINMQSNELSDLISYAIKTIAESGAINGTIKTE